MKQASYLVVDLNEQKSTLFNIDQTRVKFIDQNRITVVGHACRLNTMLDLHDTHKQPSVVIEKGNYSRILGNDPLVWAYRSPKGTNIRIPFNYTDNRIMEHDIGLQRIFGETIIGCFDKISLNIQDRSFYLDFNPTKGGKIGDDWMVGNKEETSTDEFHIHRRFFNLPMTPEDFLETRILRNATIFRFTSGKIPYYIIEYWVYEENPRKPEEGLLPVRCYYILSPNNQSFSKRAKSLKTEVLQNEMA